MGVRSAYGWCVTGYLATLLGALLATACEGFPSGGSAPTPTAVGEPAPQRLPPQVRDASRVIPAELPTPEATSVAMPPQGVPIPPPNPRRFTIEILPTATIAPSPTRAATPTPTPSRTPTPGRPAPPGPPGAMGTPTAGVPIAPQQPTPTLAAGAALPSATPTPVATRSATPLASSTLTATPTLTATRTPTAQLGGSPGPIVVFTPLPTRTPLPTATPLPAPTRAPTPTPPTPTPRAVGAPPTPYDFVAHVYAALGLLPRTDYDLVAERIRDIIEVVPPLASERVWQVQVSTKTVRLSASKMMEWGADDDNVRPWTAGLLVHLAFHVQLYDTFFEYASCEAELQALERQAKTIEALSAPRMRKTEMLGYLSGLIAESNCSADPASAHVVP